MFSVTDFTFSEKLWGLESKIELYDFVKIWGRDIFLCLVGFLALFDIENNPRKSCIQVNHFKLLKFGFFRSSNVIFVTTNLKKYKYFAGQPRFFEV